jgi:hypothetical protein
MDYEQIKWIEQYMKELSECDRRVKEFLKRIEKKPEEKDADHREKDRRDVVGL